MHQELPFYVTTLGDVSLKKYILFIQYIYIYIYEPYLLKRVNTFCMNCICFFFLFSKVLKELLLGEPE